MDLKSYVVNKFNGIRNKKDSNKSEKGSLSEALNVDVTDEYNIQSRLGFVQSQLIPNITASFCTQDEKKLFIISDGNLYLVNSDLSLELLKTDVSKDYVRWVEDANRIYMSIGLMIGSDNRVIDFNIPAPEKPNVEIVSGNLKKGRYLIRSVFQSKDHLQGCSSKVRVVHLIDDGSSLVISSASNSDYDLITFVTEKDGTIFYKQSDELSFILEGVYVGDYKMDQWQIESVPFTENPSSITYYQSSIHLTYPYDEGTVLFKSKVNWPSLYQKDKDFILLQGEVTFLCPTNNGLVVATTTHIYLIDLEDKLITLANYGTPKGTPWDFSDQNILFIFTNQGLCSFAPFKNQTEDRYSSVKPTIADLKIINEGGFDKAVVTYSEGLRADNLF